MALTGFSWGMLTDINIENIGFLDQAALELSGGVNVLTGESGAGKSVLLDALQFVTGAPRLRAPLRPGASRGRVAAQFRIQRDRQAALEQLFDELGIELEPELILSRTLDDQGRSRSFIQGRLVPRTVLAQVGQHLVEHSLLGHAQAFRKPAAQLQWLDDAAGLKLRSSHFSAKYAELLALDLERAEAEKAADEAGRRVDFLRYQLDELSCLDGVDLLAIEESAAEAGRARAAGQAAQQVLREIKMGDESVSSALRRALRSTAQLDSDVADVLLPRLEAALEAAVQAEHFLDHLVDRATPDPESELAEQRLADLRQIARKYRVSLAELEGRREALKLELERYETAPARAERAASELDVARAVLLAEGTALHEARVQAALLLEAQLTSRLKSLGLGEAQLLIQLQDAPLGPTGTTQIVLEFRSSPRVPAAPLGQIASGGEMGRVLLALLLAAPQRCPTIILDEIDAGTSGDSAAAIGATLQSESLGTQFLCVTHAPQLAALAERHFVMTRQRSAEQELSQVQEIVGDARTGELERLLGGGRAARAHAEALLQKRTPGPERLRRVA